MNNKATEHNPGASDSARFFCTQISSAAGVVDEFKKHRKEPNMANKENTTLGIGKSADFGVMHNPDASRARTRGMSYGDINNIPLTVIPRARAHVREDAATRSESALAEWRTKTFGGNFDPVRAVVEDAVAEFSNRQPEDDRRIWLKIANEIGYEALRDLYLEQCAIMREYKLRNPSAAFQNRLNLYTGHSAKKGGVA